MTMTELCRDSSANYYTESAFKFWSCSLCFSYLFRGTNIQTVVGGPGLKVPTGLNSYDGLGYAVVYPDIENSTTLEPVCAELDHQKCDRWKSCCQDAVRCCDNQKTLTDTYDSDPAYCPRTWDGWSCFGDTLAGTSVTIRCPSFIEHVSPSGYAVKHCTENGTWETSLGREWTDYGNCVDLQGYASVVYVGVICSAISILLLLPACGIFLWFRQLRSQPRIKLHICLFASFVLSAIFSILWDLVIYNDRIHNPAPFTFMVNKESACKAIYILRRYCRSTNYMWMFCEGFYLYRLIAHAFQIPRKLWSYYAFGWGVPVIPVIIYSAIRATLANDTCWVKNAAAFEWIIYLPNLLAIILNLVFLLCILRILLTQLHQHPNEPSNYRRAIKATFVLVPLFGLQLFLIIYRPEGGHHLQYIYELISKIVIDSQGAIVALIFCYLNGEVLSCVTAACQNLRGRSETGYISYATTYSVVSGRSPNVGRNSADKTYIAMKDIALEKGNQNGTV